MTVSGDGPVSGRRKLSIPGRILVRGEAEQACTLVALQGREADLRTGAPGVEGRRSTAVAYLDIIGRIEGATVRVGRDRVTLVIEAPDTKWARLCQQFARLAAMSDLERENLRGHRRLVPDMPMVQVTLPHGIVVAGHIRDLSRSGAAVESTATVAVGDRLLLGSTRAHVVRLFDGGFAVQFARLLPLELFDATFRP